MTHFEHGRALVIGVGAYCDERWDAPTAARDAHGCHDVLVDPKGAGYPRSEVELLLDGQATRERVGNALERLADRCTSKSVAFISITSHGAMGDDGLYYLATSDTQFTAAPDARIKAHTGLSVADLARALRAIPARRVLIVVNACFAGHLGPRLSQGGIGPDPVIAFPDEARKELLDTGEGRAIISASGPDQRSHFSQGADHSYFGQALIQALKSGADSERSGHVSLHELYETIYRQVRSAAARAGCAQEPTLTLVQGVGPFPVAAYPPAASSSDSSRKFHALIESLRNKRFDQIDTFLNPNEYGIDFFKEKDSPPAIFLVELNGYRRHKAAPDKHPLTINHNAPFMNERLVYLSHLGLLDQISREDIKSSLKAYIEGQHLEFELVNYLRKRQQVAEFPLPPDYIADEKVYIPLLKRWVSAVLPGDLNPYLILEPRNEIILVTGAPGSGKTTILDLLQRARRKAGALYPQKLAAAKLAGNPLPVVREAILNALLTLLTEKPALWPYLSGSSQRSSMAAQQSLDTGEQGGDLLALAVLSEQMASLKLSKLCIAVDDAPADFDYPLVREQIQKHIRQRIFLRVALRTPPPPIVYPRLDLDWSNEALADLLETIRVEGGQGWAPGWTPKVRQEQLVEIVRTPQELLTWVDAIRTCYDGNDLSERDWQSLRAAMERAREERCPGAADWQMADAEAARRVIEPQ